MFTMILIAIFLAVFSVLAWRRLDWAVLFIIASLPAYLIRFSVSGLPFTLLEAMILAAAAAWFIKSFLPDNREFLKGIFRGHRPGGRISYPYSWEIILLTIVALIAAGIAGFNPGALGIWKAYFFEPSLLFILTLNTFKDRAGVKKILGALAVSAGLVSLFALYQQLTGQFIANPFWATAETRRVVSFYGYPNAVGLFLAPISLILTGWLLSLKKEITLLKIFLALAIAASWLAIYFARSDGAIVAVLAGLVLVALLTNRRSRIAALTLVVLGAIGIFFFQPATGPIVDKIFLRDLSGEIRKQQWQETMAMLTDGRLLGGAGLDGYQGAVRPYHQEGIFYNFDDRPNFDAVVWASPELREKYWQPVEIYLYPHNIFLNFWSELGLVGLLLFVWIFAKAIISAGKLSLRLNPSSPDKYLASGITAALSTLIVHGLVDVPYFKNDLAALFWIILALGAILKLINSDRPEAALPTR